MDRDIDLSGTGLGVSEKRAVTVFMESLITREDVGLKAVILYGSALSDRYRPGAGDIDLLVLVDALDVASLRRVLDPVFQGRQAGIAPFFMTLEDMRAAADVFPLKFLAMKSDYRVLYGDDLLAPVEVKKEYAAVRVRQRIVNMLLKMRRHYILNSGQRLTAMMAQQIDRFIETLGFILDMQGIRTRGTEEIVDRAANEFGLDKELLNELRRLQGEETALASNITERLFGGFLDVLERTARILREIDAKP